MEPPTLANPDAAKTPHRKRQTKMVPIFGATAHGMLKMKYRPKGDEVDGPSTDLF